MTLKSLKLDKWTEILVLIDKYETATELCKSTGMTNSHTLAIIQYFLKYKLVSVKRIGRRKVIKVTDKGLKTIKIIKDLREQIQ